MPIAAALLALALGALSAAPQGVAQGPEVTPPVVHTRQEGGSPILAKSLEEAKERATLQSRLVLLVFLGERCPACPLIERHILTDPRVVEWMEAHVIALVVHDDAELAERFSVSKLPTIMLLGPGLNEIDRVTEYLEPPILVAALVDFYEGRGGLASAQRAVKASPEDPDAHLQLARALAGRGRGYEAIEEYMWAFDNLRGNTERQEERLRTILGEIKVLQRTQASATRAMQERRERAVATLIEAFDPETPLPELVLSARELVQFNIALGKVDHTFFAWDTLRKRENMPPEVLDELFVSSVQGRLIQEQRYQDYLDGIGDPLVLLDASLAELQQTKKVMAEAGRGKREIANAGNGIAFSASWYYEALDGVGRTEEAASVVELLIAIEPTAQAYISMISVVNRCTGKEQGLALQERGRAALPEGSEKKRFELVTNRLLSGSKR